MPKKLLDIVKYPNDVLRQKSEEVVDFGGPKLYSLALDMIHTMRTVGGVGLAASQVGLPIRFAIVLLDKIPHILINPKIIDHAKEFISINEACLSCPNEFIKIDRWAWIKVEYFTLRNKKIEVLAHGINAIIVQHELDHLDGKLIIDYKR